MPLKKIKSKYKIIFGDLDDTLISANEPNTFPKGIWDMVFKFDIWDEIKKLDPEYLFIVTNQGGIGKYVNKEHFEGKCQYVCDAIQEYTKIKNVDWTYCSTTDKDDPYRKPNAGMANTLVLTHNLFINKDFNNEDCIMIGDADGTEGTFSDSDKKFAENVFGGIDFISPKELLEIKDGV